MALREELKDPWGWLIAVILGGLAWAVLGGGVGVLIGVGVAATVVTTKAAIGASMHRQQPALPRRSDALPLPDPRSTAGGYLRRAEEARARMLQIAERPGDPWLRQEVGRMDDGVDEVVASMRDLGGRVALTDELIVSANGHQLMADQESITQLLAQTTDPLLAAERQRALAAVEEQLEGLSRLAQLREQLLTRMHTAAVGLENLTTRMGEVVTLGTAAYENNRAEDLLRGAGDDLESLRTGLAEAQRLARGMD